MLRPVRLTRGVPTTGALEATPTICLQQHDCIASLVGKASSENKSAGRVGVVPRIVLVVGVGVCVRIWDVETMPEILLAFSHGFGEMWHSDMISAFSRHFMQMRAFSDSTFY